MPTPAYTIGPQTPDAARRRGATMTGPVPQTTGQRTTATPGLLAAPPQPQAPASMTQPTEATRPGAESMPRWLRDVGQAARDVGTRAAAELEAAAQQAQGQRAGAFAPAPSPARPPVPGSAVPMTSAPYQPAPSPRAPRAGIAPQSAGQMQPGGAMQAQQPDPMRAARGVVKRAPALAQAVQDPAGAVERASGRSVDEIVAEMREVQGAKVPEDLTRQEKGLMLMEMGFHIMSGGPSMMQAIGQAGLHTMGTYRQMQAAKRDEQARRRQAEMGVLGTEAEVALSREEQAAKARQPVKMRPGEALVSPQTGETVAEGPAKAQEPYSDIGQLRADLGAGRITPEDFARSLQQGDAATASMKTREHKINEYMELFDLPRDEATLRVDRGYDLHTTSDGRLVERNPITLETKDVTPPHPQFTLPGQEQQGEQDVQPAPQEGEPEQERAAGQRQVPQERTLWSLAEGSPGVMRSLEEVGSAVSGQFGGPIAEETIDARQAFRTALGELRRSLAINPRFPVGEMERIESEIQISPSAWDNPDSLRQRLRSIDESLQMRIDNELATANNSMLPSEQRGAAMQAATNLHNFRQLMGVPREGAREAPQQGEAQAQPGMPEAGTVEEGYRFKGGDPADPDSWEPVR